MKTINIPRTARGINALLQEARRMNLIVRSPDGHEFILAEVEDFDREIELARENKDLMAFLEKRARQTRTVPLKEVRKQLGLA